ncbi:MAG TPA: OmpA family protein [Cytophagaceae bacterium]|jgi:outer membrane protein OmpA-like peptidoglycan-associated protein|nr:OmpA family protein [Cytophagaceae bacterium]
MKKILIVGLLVMMTTLAFAQTKKSFIAFGSKMSKSYKCSHVGIQKIKKNKFKKKAVAEIREMYSTAIASVTAAKNDSRQADISESNHSLHKTIYAVDSTYTPALPLPSPVYFRFDTDELSYADLRQVILAVEHAKLGKFIILEGHTDFLGTDHYNRHLSLKRANKIKAMMIDLGVAADAIAVVGHGEAKPATLQISDTHRQLNRRVEFVVMNKN